jgi:hypothetical protein
MNSFRITGLHRQELSTFNSQLLKTKGSQENKSFKIELALKTTLVYLDMVLIIPALQRQKQRDH